MRLSSIRRANRDMRMSWLTRSKNFSRSISTTQRCPAAMCSRARSRSRHGHRVPDGSRSLVRETQVVPALAGLGREPVESVDREPSECPASARLCRPAWGFPPSGRARAGTFRRAVPSGWRPSEVAEQGLQCVHGHPVNARSALVAHHPLVSPPACSHGIKPSPGSQGFGLRCARRMPRPLDAQPAVFSAVPPPTFRSRSGFSAFWSASGSDIECSAPKRFTWFGPSRGDAALRSPAVSALSGQCLDRAGRQPATTMASADFCRPIGPPCDGPSP